MLSGWLTGLCWVIFFYTTQAYLLRIVPFTVGWALPHQLLTKIIFHRFGHRIIWWRQLFDGGFSFLLTLGYIKSTAKFKQDTFPIQNNIFVSTYSYIYLPVSLLLSTKNNVFYIPLFSFQQFTIRFLKFSKDKVYQYFCSSKLGGIQFKVFLLLWWCSLPRNISKYSLQAGHQWQREETASPKVSLEN